MPAYAIQIALILTTVLVNLFIIFNFYHRISERTYQSKAIYVSAFMLGAVLITCVNIIGNPFLNVAVYSLFIFAVGVLLYGMTRASNVLFIILLILFLMLTEVVGQFTISILFSASFSISAGNLVQSIITFFSFQIVMHFFEGKKAVSFQVPENWVMLVIIPASSIFLITAILNLLSEDATYVQIMLATFSCVLVFVVNIVVYFLFNRIAVLHLQKEQYSMMEQQRQMQYRYFNELEQKYESSRKLFHDIHNHMNTLEHIYVHEGTKAAEYIQTLRGYLNETDLPIGNNRVLNILLYDRARVAKANGIAFETVCEDIDLSFIADFDLTTILGNLLDNAFDECMMHVSSSNEIHVRICQINCFIVMIISNSCANAPVNNGNRFISQKEGHAGFGLLNVRETAEKYSATLNQSFADGMFTVQITFPGQKMGV